MAFDLNPFWKTLKAKGARDFGIVRAKHSKRVSKVKPSKKPWIYFRMFVRKNGSVIIFQYEDGYPTGGNKGYDSISEFFFEWNADRKFVLTEKRQKVRGMFVVIPRPEETHEETYDYL